MLFKLSNLNLNFALTLGYLNSALNNSSLETEAINVTGKCHDVSARENERLKVFKHKQKEKVKLSFKKLAKKRERLCYLLVRRLCALDIAPRVINWIIDFLSARSRRIKLSEGCVSAWGTVPSGVPQGTKLGP